MTSYAQIGQDTSVSRHYNYKRNGYFVEVGAYDGLTFSNTYLLESRYGWTGICIEPLPDKFELLVQRRPESICVDRAVFSLGDLTVDFCVADLLSGMVDYIDCHREVLNNHRIKVKTIQLNDVLKQCRAPHYIDYISFDTEGTELEILKSIDYDTYQFGMIHVEHNNLEPKRNEMRQLLISKGYTYSRENQWDDEYIRGTTSP